MDSAFKNVYTPTIMRFVYAVAPLGLFIVWVGLTLLGFWWNTWAGVIALVIVGPGLLIGGMLVLRVLTEVVLLLVRAADDLHAIRTSGGSLKSE
jgi:hypothetical protein